MDAQRLRRRCEARLRQITFPNPFAIETFAASVASWRGRPIELVPSSFPPGLHGLLVAEDTTDYLFYRSDTTPLHRRHIILHELGHVVFGHRGLNVDSLTSLLQSGADSRDAAALVARFPSHEEQEAETFATLVLERTEGASSPPDGNDPHATRTLRLLHDLTGMAYGY